MVPSGNPLTQCPEQEVGGWNWQKAPQGTRRSLGQAAKKPIANTAGTGAGPRSQALLRVHADGSSSEFCLSLKTESTLGGEEAGAL